LLCKLFGFLICGIGNVGDIRHLVQCFLAQWHMKSCLWWVLCSYCKHLKSFGFGVCRMLMMQMKTNLSTKAMIGILPFCLLLERQNRFWWEMRMSCRPFATCSAIKKSYIVDCLLLSPKSQHLLQRCMFSGGERTTEFVVLFYLWGYDCTHCRVTLIVVVEISLQLHRSFF
jgi:hypothetical protein